MENAIVNQVRQLFTATDQRNWESVRAVMAGRVLMDYSSMNGQPAKSLTAKEITDGWAAFLPAFDMTRHVLSDIDVTVGAGEALVTYRGRADHLLNTATWRVEGTYVTKLKLGAAGKWLITAQTFNLEKQSGDTNLPVEAARIMAARNV